MEFYCERAKLKKARREECENCTHFQLCLDDGYLAKIDEKHGFNYSGENKLQALARAAQRALRPNISKKDLNLKKISGTTGYFIPIFKVKDFQKVVDSLGLPIDPEKLFKASAYYLEEKKIWDDNPFPRELKSAAEKISKKSKQLSTELENLSSKIYNALKSASYDLDNLRIESHRVANFIGDKFGRGDKLGNYPKVRYIRYLAQIYEEDTGKKPTISYDPTLNKCSELLQLLNACLNIVD